MQPYWPEPVPVLHILGTAELEGTGIARLVGELAARLDPCAYRVHACFLGERGPLIDELQKAGAVAQHVRLARGARDPLGAWQFWNYLRKHDFAIVHQHFGARSVRRLIKTASRAKLIVHLHGQIDERATVGNIPIAVWKADSVIAVSRSVALQVPQFNPIVVYNGVSTARAEAPTRRSPSKAVVVGTACRLVPLKGVSCLLRAMAELHAEFPNVQLDIAGRGPSLESLVHEAERLGLAKQVRFLGWQNNLRPILRNWDIFVLPSLDEGLPLAVLEAMAAGLPIVGTLVGGLPELIHHGCTGFLVPPNDPQSLAQQLRHLIVSPELRSSQGAAARQLAQRDFSSAKMVAQIRAVYDHLVTERNLRSKSKSESAMTQTYQV